MYVKLVITLHAILNDLCWNCISAWGNLANIFNSQNKKIEAEEAYRNALKERGNMADVHYNL